MYLSPYVEKPFNSKVIKSFAPEIRSRKCFLCFGIPMLSICALWTFYVYFTYPYHGYVTHLVGIEEANDCSVISPSDAGRNYSHLSMFVFEGMLEFIEKLYLQHGFFLLALSHFVRVSKTDTILTRHAGLCWRSKDKLISDVFLWTSTYGRAKAERPARTYIQQLCEDMGCSPEDLPKAMNDREKWRERVRDIRAGGMTWWWWWWCSYSASRYSQNWNEIAVNIYSKNYIYIYMPMAQRPGFSPRSSHTKDSKNSDWYLLG